MFTSLIARVRYSFLVFSMINELLRASHSRNSNKHSHSRDARYAHIPPCSSLLRIRRGAGKHNVYVVFSGPSAHLFIIENATASIETYERSLCGGEITSEK